MEDWMHRKTEGNAHNEILAFLITVLGVNLFVGGLIVVILVAKELSWLLNTSICNHARLLSLHRINFNNHWFPNHVSRLHTNPYTMTEREDDI
ncbi:MAG: hypothetical protein FGF53_07190 [Candidatus Brockarchaeota archaeon]|nr:hypothetical protein [Candidatus Brockarchaeota archaeon]